MTFHWIGGSGAGGNLWSTPANWAENQTPTPGSALVFDTTTPGFSASTNGFAPQNDLAAGTNFTIAINDASSAGDFAITGNPIALATTAGPALTSTVSVGAAATVNNNLALGTNTTANVGYGTLTLGGVIGGGFSLTAANGVAGTLTLNGANTFSGGTVVASGIVSVGNNAALGTGTLALNGGTLINATSFLHLPNAFVVNAPSTIGGGGFFDLDGNGTLNANLSLGNNGFLGLGGALSGPGGLIEDGAFTGSTTLKGTSPNTFTGGTTVISGGVALQKTPGVNALASAVTVVGSSGSLTLKANNQLNGGVAVAIGQGGKFATGGFSDSVLSLTGLGNLDTASTAGAGLTITGGGNQMLSGQLTGSGFLTYAGPGSYTLAVSSPSSYTGTLTVASGSLIVASNLAAPVVVTGGTLGGTGAVRSVTATSGVINPGTAGTAGTLNTAAATPNALNGATFRVDVGLSGPSDHLALTPNATLNLTGTALAVNVLTPTLADSYQIITSPTGGLSGTFNGLPEGATFTDGTGGHTFRINYTANAVTVTSVGAASSTLHWTGAVSSAWGTAGNWFENRTPVSGDTLVFDTSAPGFAGTTAAFAPVNAASGLTNMSLVINDAASAGDFSITGTGIGLATSSAPAITSTVTVGTSTPSATIGLPLTLGADTTMSVGLGSLTLGGAISGGFALNAANAPNGTLILNVANSYSGGTVLTSGTVSVNNNAALGTGTLTLNGGTLINATSFLHLPNAFVVNAPSTIGGGGFFDLDGNGTLNANLRLTNTGFLSLNGALSGTGGLIEDGFPGGTTLTGSTPNTFSGPTTIISGSLTLKKTSGVTALASPTVALGGGAFPTLSWGANNQLNGTVSIDLRDAGKLSVGTFSDSIAALSGNGSIDTGSGAGASLTVTGAGANLTKAAVSGSGALAYNGSGSLTLGGASSTYTGTLTAVAGSLLVAGDFSGASGLPLSGATLGGTGLLGTLKNGINGTVNPGGIGSGGILTTKAGSLVSALSGQGLRVDLNGLGLSDQLVVGGGATLDLGGAVLDVNVLNSTAGAVYPIISSATGGITGTFLGLPTGATLSANGRLFRIDYTPNAVTLTDIQTISLTPAALQTGEVGFAYNQTITPVGGTGAVTLAVSNITTVPGLMITGDGTNAITVSGTPTATGTVTFTVTPTDSFGPGTAQVYSFTVNPPITLPAPSSLPTGELGFAYNQTITPSGGTGAVTLTVSNVTNTTGLTIGGSGTGTITLSGTPTGAGTVTFTVTPTDSLGTQAGTVYSITVAPAVTLTPSSLPTGEVGFAYSKTITPTGGTGAVTLTVSNVTNNTGLNIGGTGTGTITVSGTPTSAGTVTFTVTPTDSFGPGTAKVYSFAVNPAVSLTPAALPAGQVGTVYNRTITPIGGVAPVTLTVSNVTNPTGLAIIGSGTGTITVAGTPVVAGTVTFTVTPTDANGAQTSTVYTITVDPATPGSPAPPAPPAPTPPAPPYYSNAFVVGGFLVLQGSGVPGGTAVLTVPPGWNALFTDTNGDGKGDLVLITPNLIAVLDGATGRFLILVTGLGTPNPQFLVFNPDGTSTRVL